MNGKTTIQFRCQPLLLISIKMSKIAKYKRQGNLDNLCGIYVVINSMIKACSGIFEINHFFAQALFIDVIDYLHEHKLLYRIMTQGTSVKRLKTCLTIMKEQFSSLEVEFEFPFKYSMRYNDLVKELRVIANKPNTAVILSLKRQYNHWTLLDKITNDRIYFIDSAGISYITIFRLTDLYELPPDEICIVTVKEKKNNAAKRV